MVSVTDGKEFRITGTLCKHFPIGEMSGFFLDTDNFGTDEETGNPKAIYFSGDTVSVEELQRIKEGLHITAAVLNLGSATFWFPIRPM